MAEIPTYNPFLHLYGSKLMSNNIQSVAMLIIISLWKRSFIHARLGLDVGSELCNASHPYNPGTNYTISGIV